MHQFNEIMEYTASRYWLWHPSVTIQFRSSQPALLLLYLTKTTYHLPSDSQTPPPPPVAARYRPARTRDTALTWPRAVNWWRRDACVAQPSSYRRAHPSTSVARAWRHLEGTSYSSSSHGDTVAGWRINLPHYRSSTSVHTTPLAFSLSPSVQISTLFVFRRWPSSAQR